MEISPKPIDVERTTFYHGLLFAICLLSNIFGGAISVLMSVYLPVAVRDLLGTVEPERFNYVSAYVGSVFIFGWAFGGIAWGMLGDRMGRARTLGLSIAFYGLFTLIIAFTSSWQWVIVLRFLTGFCIGGVLVITPTLLSEVWPERTRPIIIGILSIGFPIGIFSAGLIDLFVANWQQAFLVGLIPLALSLFSFWIVDESKSWQTDKTKGRAEVASRFDRRQRGDIYAGVVTFGAMLIGLWAIFSWLPTWVQTLLTTSDGQQERGLAMMVLGAGGLTGGFFSGWLSKAIGNRGAVRVCFAVCFIMSFLLFKTNTVFSVIIYFEIAILAFFFGASQGVLSAYIPALFPPATRATATGICFNIGRFLTATAVFFVGALVVILGGYGNAIFIFSLIFVVGLITTFFSKS